MTRLPILIAALLCATGASAQQCPPDSKACLRDRAEMICNKYLHSFYHDGRLAYGPEWKEPCARLEALQAADRAIAEEKERRDDEARQSADRAWLEQYLNDAGAKR